MFSVTQYSCATGYYSFGHEVGHNLGMFHDSGTQNSCNETATFSYGYRDPNAEFRTMLSYDCKIGECDSMPKNGCPRVQRFSNSDTKYTYNGKPIGDSRRDNAKQGNNVRALVASFFPAMNCQTDAECNDSNSNTTDTCNTANRVCVFTPLGALTKAPIRAPTTAPSTRSPTKAVTRLPTIEPSRAPITTVPTSQKPILSIPIPISAPTTVSTSPTTQPIRAPNLANLPTTGSSKPIGAPSISQPTVSSTSSQIVPTQAPFAVVDEPIVGQEQKGFFSVIFHLLGGFLTRLIGG
jgi:hypothetical protein